MKEDNTEYIQIVEKLLSNRKFNKLKEETHHHNSNRFNHSLDVSYKTYKICKKLGLDYESAARAALLHDFFFVDEFNNKRERMLKHPYIALANAEKITEHAPTKRYTRNKTSSNSLNYFFSNFSYCQGTNALLMLWVIILSSIPVLYATL